MSKVQATPGSASSSFRKAQLFRICLRHVIVTLFKVRVQHSAANNDDRLFPRFEQFDAKHCKDNCARHSVTIELRVPP